MPLRKSTRKMSTPPPRKRVSSSSSSSGSERNWKRKYKKLKRDLRELKHKRNNRRREKLTITADDAAVSTTTQQTVASVTKLRPNLGDEQLIPVFDPDGDNEQIELWIKKIDEVSARYRWDDVDIVRLASLRLRGHARMWYDDLRHLDFTWAEMKVSLVKKFKTVVRFSGLLKRAANYEIRPGQSLGDYCFQKLQRLNALQGQFPNEFLIDAVIGGVTNNSVARTLSSMRFRDTDDLYSYMRAMGSVPVTTTRRQFTGTREGKEKFEVPRPSSSKQSPNLQKTENSQYKSLLTCYNCSAGGHIARNCPKPRRECRTVSG